MRYGLRLRQLASLKRCKTRLYCKGIAHDQQQDMTALAATLDAVMPGSTRWDARLVQDLQILSSIGIMAVEDMLIPTRTHLALASHLQCIVSRRKVQAKHKRAWNRITHYLHTNTPHTRPEAVQTTDKCTKDREIHRDVLESLENMWPANKTAKPRTILHILASLPAHNAKQAAAARDTLWKHPPDFPRAHNKPNKTADIRNQQDGIKQVANPRRYETGYAQYTKAVQLTGQRLLNTMHDLYTL